MNIKHLSRAFLLMGACGAPFLVAPAQAQQIPTPVTIQKVEFDKNGTDADLSPDWTVTKSGGVTIGTGDQGAGGLYIATTPNEGGPGTAAVKGNLRFSLGEQLALVFTTRMSAYVEQFTVYGNRQPRGLADGFDRRNAIEFLTGSPPENSVVCRTTANNVMTQTQVNIGHTVNRMTTYQIVARPTIVDFFIDGKKVCTHTTNIPTTPLNPHFATSDGGAGNVPVLVDWVSFERVVQ